jgi:hypothetical protein
MYQSGKPLINIVYQARGGSWKLPINFGTHNGTTLGI